MDRLHGSARLVLAAMLLLAALAAAPATAGGQTVTVFAAASLKNALEEIAERFRMETGHGVRMSFAGTSALARQIEQGAPADIFISANPDWMDHLEAAGLVDPTSRFDLVGNSLVLIAHGRDAEPVELGPTLDLSGLLGKGRLAMALVEAVPAGIYGKAALQSLGLWQGVEPKVVQTDNVRAALALVALGEAGLGIVYATDAAAEDRVRVIATFPSDSHSAIVYPVAAVAARPNPLSDSFLAFLRGSAARTVFERQGFAAIAE